MLPCPMVKLEYWQQGAGSGATDALLGLPSTAVSIIHRNTEKTAVDQAVPATQREADLSTLEQYSGWGGIRTHGTVTRTAVFKTAAFVHSATHPV